MSLENFGEQSPEKRLQADWMQQDGIILFRPDYGSGSYNLDMTSVRDVLAHTVGEIAVTEEIRQEILASELFECINRECDDQDYFVNPISSIEKEGGLFRVHLRCANCELDVIRDATQEQVDLFDKHLDESYEEVGVIRRELLQQIAEDETDLLIDAINTDRILPMDF